MDVRLSSEQRALQESAAQLVERLRPETVRELDDHERTAKLDAAVASSGWRELRAADDDGAPWSSAVEVAIVAEELGRGVADVAFRGPVLAADLRRLAGAPAAQANETVALTSDLSSLVTADGGALAASGVAFDAASAESALVLVPHADGHTLASVSLSSDAAPAGPDLTSVSRVVPSGAAVTVVDGARTIGAADLERWTSLGLAVACADLVGAMDGAIRLARDYALARKQYGALIGSFQAVQHLLADAYVAMEGSRSIALHAAWAVDALDSDEAMAAASAAKAYCARAARDVCEAVIQVHGGIGNTWEHLAHVYLRRTITATDLLGGIGVCLARVLEQQRVGGAHGLR